MTQHWKALDREAGRGWCEKEELFFYSLTFTWENQSSAQWRRTIIQQQYTKLPKSFYDRLSYHCKTIHIHCHGPWSHLRNWEERGNDGMTWENWEPKQQNRKTIIQQWSTKLPKQTYKTKLRWRPSTTKGNDGMIWENWERDVVLVENILLYFVIVITFVAFVIVLGCSCYKFFRYRECF